ncbi:MAG: hypothetical protein JWN25_2984 [Verrucomicrobiales bacterium]|nr:hypothetical protein [Verrucomicrobiales bacterium]
MTELPEIKKNGRYTYAETAQILEISLNSLRKIIQKGDLSPVIIGHRTRYIPGHEIIAFLRRCGEIVPV